MRLASVGASSRRDRLSGKYLGVTLPGIVTKVTCRKLPSGQPLSLKQSEAKNNGVIVSGGSIQTSTFAGGQGAKSEVVQEFGRTSDIPTATSLKPATARS
jgi:hypothetical protein